MIKFREQVPSIYISASRDFQYLSWLIDIVLNSVKHNVDSLYNLPNIADDARLSELLAMTLGFKVKRNYDQKQLAALVAILPRILKYKGTLTAVAMAGKALIAASGASGEIDCKSVNGELRVTLPKKLVDISLFTDLLPYILPAGMTSRIIRTDLMTSALSTELGCRDAVSAELIPDIDWDRDVQTNFGASRLFEVGSNFNEYANFQSSADETGTDDLRDRFTAGLLTNTIIAAVEPIEDPESNT